MFVPRYIRIAAAAGGALLLGGAVVVVTASASGKPVAPFAASPSPKASAAPNHNAKAQACSNFVNHLASNLGKKPADVDAAAQKAFTQTIDDAVKSGQLTAEQAAQLKQHAPTSGICSGALSGLGRAGAAAGPGVRGEHADFLKDAATALGMSSTDLQTQLKSGQTLQQIAASKGMDEAAFRSKFGAAVKTDLDAKVAAGKLTSDQEQSELQRLQTAPLPFWNGPAAHFPARPKPSPSASATTS